MNANIRIVPILQSEDGFYLCFSAPGLLTKELERKKEQWQEVYTTRFKEPPTEIRYNEVAKLYELGPVPNS